MVLPPLPDSQLLKDVCQEVAQREGFQPAAIEKDFYLTRLIWAVAQEQQKTLLLKGGTLLSKVDLEHKRMSEDADFVVPSPPQRKRENALRMNKIRDLLQEIKPDVGVRLRFPHGNRSDQHSGCIWELPYNSPFGPQQIVLEVPLRPVLREPRQVHLRQLIPPTELNGYESAFCW